MKRRLDAIVIGAGAAGLTVAHTLKQAGAEVVVLEASSRIGGRIHTNGDLGIPIELGANWLHEPDGNPLFELAKKANVSLETIREDFTVFLQRGRPITGSIVDGSFDATLRAINRVQRRSRPGESLKSALARLEPEILEDPLTSFLLKTLVQFDGGCPLDRLSARYLQVGSGFYGEDLLVTSGYDAICELLADNLRIEFESAVTGVEVNQDGVRVSTGTEHFEAEFCVCTVSIGVLASGRIQFVPQLPPEFRHAIDSIGFGTVEKLVLQYEERFWDTETLHFGTTAAEDGRYQLFLDLSSITGRPILIGFALGAFAPQAARLTQAERLQAATDSLSMMFDEVPDQPERSMATRWAEDPLFLGAYSFVSPEANRSDFRTFERPAHDRLFFAGEHTIWDHRASVHGAILSGKRVAERILAT